MSSKKGKKSKGKTMNIYDFHQKVEETMAEGSSKPSTMNWADDFDDEDPLPMKKPVNLPTAPRASRDPDYDDKSIPHEPPFTAYISNLPYDTEEEDIVQFFADMNIVHVRLPKEANKQKGYGYVEFEDRGSLVMAMNKQDRYLNNRLIRIELSTNSSNERGGDRGGQRDRGGMGRENRREYNDDPERTTGDWRSGGRDDGGAPPERDGDRDRPYRVGGGGRDRDGERGGDRGGNRGFDRERSDREGIDNERWRDGDRPRDAERPRMGYRDGGNRGGDDRDNWNRFPKRGDDERDGGRGGGGFGPRRGFGGDSDRGDRDRDRDRGGDSERRWERGPRSNPPPSGSGEESGEPRTRPKLNLQPRTKPIDPIKVAEAPEPQEDVKDEESKVKPLPEEPEEQVEQDKPKPAPVPAANIFGAAKPVDTAAREREIEERMKRDAEARGKDAEGDKEGAKKPPAWGRRNGENREAERDRPRPAWRTGNNATDDDKSSRKESAQPDEPTQPSDPSSKPSGASKVYVPPKSQVNRNTDSHNAPSRGEKEKPEKNEEHKKHEKHAKNPESEEEISKMPKAKEIETPNFVASNKFSALTDEADPDGSDE